MIFQNEKVSLYLEVVKYQFENANNACDRNWLIVKVKLLEVNKVYNMMDPFFKTSDLQHMKNWFQSLPNPPYKELDFIEPTLAFEFIGEYEGGFHIVIRLLQELNPLWCKEEEYEFSISITQEYIEEMIRSIEQQQRKFPKR